MDNLKEIRGLAETRLEESKVLFREGYYDGCIYLAGYTIEFLLAKIAQLLDVPNLFVSFRKEKIKVFRSHIIRDLALYAGLHRLISEEENETFKDYWSLIYTQWSEDLRYRKKGTCTKSRAEDFLKAIEDPKNG